jgi:putative transposase
MARIKQSSLIDPLVKILPRAMVEAEAKRLGVVKRKRKVDIWALVCTLVLGFQEGTERTLVGLKQSLTRETGTSLVRSAFHKRLTTALAKLLHGLVVTAMDACAATVGIPSGTLSGFKDLLAIDSTVLRLHECLAGPYKACRTNHTKAAAKLHLVASVVDGSPRQVKLTSEATNDRTPWRRVGRWVENCLLLFDLGYFSYHLFDRIEQNGGFFLTRLKKNANPLLVSALRVWRGQSVDIVGRRLQEILPLLQREVLDAEVEVVFTKRTYAGHRTRARRTFRLIAIRNAETGEYHTYLTNLPPDRLDAEEVSRIYAMRWQIEILFKAMKHHGHLDHLPSGKRCVVECLIWASMLSLLASQALFREIRRAVAANREIPILRWATLFARNAATLHRLLLHPDPGASDVLLRLLIEEAPDPNRNRKGRSNTGLVAWTASA